MGAWVLINDRWYKSLVEGGLDIADAAIPATLQASLTERLDRLGEAKEIAQIGAVIGREFPHAVLAAVAEMPAAALEHFPFSLVHILSLRNS